jgi:hypothetical protein
MALPGLHPPKVVPGLYQVTISPQVLAEAEEALVLAHQMSVRFLPVYIPTEENILADAASYFQEIPPHHLQGDHGQMGSSGDRPLFQRRLQADRTFLQLERLQQSGRDRRPMPEVGLPPRIRVPAGGSPQDSSEEAGVVQGDLNPDLPHVGSPDMAGITSNAESAGGLTAPLPGGPSNGSDDGQAPPILPHLRLVAWRISVGSNPSKTSQATSRISSRQGGDPPQKTATKELGKPSSAIFEPPKFLSMKLV